MRYDDTKDETMSHERARSWIVALGLAAALLAGGAAGAQEAEIKPLPEKKDCWGELGPDGQPKTPRVSMDGEEVPLILRAGCVDTGETARFSIQSGPTILTYARVKDPAGGEDLYELRSAKLLFETGHLASARVNCSDFPAIFQRYCPPVIGGGGLNTCSNCAMVVNNCWKNCGDAAVCNQYDKYYPPIGQPQGTEVCPHDRCYYVDPCYGTETAMDLRQFKGLDSVLALEP